MGSILASILASHSAREALTDLAGFFAARAASSNRPLMMHHRIERGRREIRPNRCILESGLRPSPEGSSSADETPDNIAAQSSSAFLLPNLLEFCRGEDPIGKPRKGQALQVDLPRPRERRQEEAFSAE